MDPTWTLGVLPAGVENVIPLRAGQAPTRATAAGAAVDALVDVAAALGRSGRQEYRLTIADTQMIVMPGLTADGLVDLVALRGIADRYRAY